MNDEIGMNMETKLAFGMKLNAAEMTTEWRGLNMGKQVLYYSLVFVLHFDVVSILLFDSILHLS